MKKSGIYIHIPFCKIKCIYCDFYSITNKESMINQFVKSLIDEINYLTIDYDLNLKIDTIFFGGGTPSILDSKSYENIINALNKKFNLSHLKEMTIEANPGECNLKLLKNLKKLGFNRLSIGIQSLHRKHLKFLSRIHSPKDSIQTFNNAISAGFENINTDLIYNIPGQSVFDWEKDLYKIINLGPTHISAYSLTVEKNTELYSLTKNKSVIMPNESIEIEMFKMCKSILKTNNYSQYEISNYCKPGFECKHNLHYWKMEPYFAFGPSANGFDGKKRWTNIKSLEGYINLIQNKRSAITQIENLSKKDLFNENILNGLRLIQGLNKSTIKNLSNTDVNQHISHLITKWDPLIVDDGEKIYLNDKGLLFADEIISELFIT